MGDNVEPIHRCHPGAFAVGQSQPPADGLLNEDAGIGGSKRHNGIEVGHIPTLFEHVDVDDDLGRLLGLLHPQQPLDHFFLILAGLARIHLDDLVGIASFEKGLGLDHPQQLPGMGGVAGNDEQEGLDYSLQGLAGIGFQLHLDALMEPDTVFQFQPLDLFH